MKKIIIAIDGFSACGKSTLAKDLALSLQYRHFDSGAMYRAVTYFFIQNDLSVYDRNMVISALNRMDLGIIVSSEGISRITLSDQELSRELRSAEVDQHVSNVSAIPEVRHFLVDMQQKLGKKRGVVMDGRDIGSVVFPDAELKIFLTASLEVRVNRRLQELSEDPIRLSRDEVRENLIKRDHIDSTREISPLTQTPDAVVIDNSNLTRLEQRDMILTLAQLRMKI